MATKRPYSMIEEQSTYGSSTVVMETVAASTSTSSQQAPVLKLRIKQHTPSQKLSLEIYEAKNSKDKLKSLLHFAHGFRLSHINIEESEVLLRLLKDLIKKEGDVTLRAKAIELMGIICCIPGVNKALIAEDIVDSLHKENNHVVISQIFKTLTNVSSLLSIKSDLIQKILKAAVKRLDDSHQDVRCSCLHLIGRICPNEPIKISSSRSVDALELFAEFCDDQDPRVRAVVYQSLLTLQQRLRDLDVSVYEKACQALNDDYENVRLAAVKLVWVFSNIFPERLLPHPHIPDEDIRLLDDAFIRVCNMVNDSSWKVRAEAVGLLGSLHNVSFHVLEQTLDKKLMSRGKKTKSFNQRQLERFRGEDSGGPGGGGNSSSSAGGGGGGGQWSTGKTWGDKSGDQKIEEEEIKLMNSGSCGVFVRALEDEFMEVRIAGVDSLCELANQNGTFAAMSTDFLVDMFNDEIESVRLNSIHSLVKLHEYVDLREDQLDTILECLNDYNQVVRNSVRDLLAHCTLSTRACLHATVLALLANLKKYPHDAESIWSCMKDLGLHHPHFVSSLVPDLLVTHPYYAVPEPRIEDSSHIAVTTLVFNAMLKCQSIRSILPSHVISHYDYLKDTFPRLIPELPGMVAARKNTQECDDNEVTQFFQTTLQRVYKLMKRKSPNVTNAIEVCIQDLQHIKNIHKLFAPASEFVSLFLRCQLLLQKCRCDRAWTVPAALASNECSSLQNDVKELLMSAYKLEYLFCGLSGENVCTIKMIRILAHSLSVLLELRTVSKLQQPKRIDLKLWEIFLHRLHKFKEHVNMTSSSNDVKSDQLKTVFELQETIEENLSSLSTLVSLIQRFFLTYPIDLKLENRLRQESVRIIEPKENLDSPLRFSSGLTVSVDLEAEIENVDVISSIYIKIIYPDLQVRFHKPNICEFKKLSSLKYRLVCKVLLSHHTWTEASHVKITVVKNYPTDIKEEITSTHNELVVPTLDRVIRSTGTFQKNYQGFLDLSKEVRVYIQPKAVSR